MEKKQGKAPLIILIVLLLLMAIAGSSVGGYLFGKSDINKVIKKKNAECKKKVEEARKDEASKCDSGSSDQCECDSCESSKCEPEKPKCYGTYTQDGTDGKTKWVLQSNGTFVIEGQEKFGVFYIKDNTIIFVESKHTTGKNDPSYGNPKAYLISDDCKKITLSSGKIGSGLTKQD